MTKAVAKLEEAPAPVVQTEAAAIFHMIERIAAQPDVPVDRVEKLFELYQKMESERARREYFAALAEMLPDMPVIEKRGTIKTNEKDQSGNKIGQKDQSKYAKWEDIVEKVNPILTKHGFAISFKINQPSPDRVAVTCTLSHRAGHAEDTTFALPIENSGSKNNVQGWGSSVSYAKRYTASALLNIVARGEDDDGKSAGAGEPISEEQFKVLADLMRVKGVALEKFLEVEKIESLSDLPKKRFTDCKRRLEAVR